MSSSHVLKLGKLKGNGIILKAARHNKRQIQAERGADSHIEASRIKLNYCLAGEDTPEGVANEAKTLMEGAGLGMLRKDAVLGIEIIFSLPANLVIDSLAFFIDCHDWIPSNFGGHVLSFDCHLDEAAPHAHAIILPLVDGSMKGSDLVGNATRLRHLHGNFHVMVGMKYGLKKPAKRLAGEVKTKTAKAVLDSLKSDAVRESNLWPFIRDQIASDPAPYADVLGIPVAVKKPPSSVAIMTSNGKG